MSEKRFTYGETIDYNFFDVFEEKKYLGMIQRDSTKIVDRLNEQQADLNYLARFIGEFKVEEFKLKLRNLRMLEDKLQISEASLALLIDMILFGDVDELVKRARECAEQFDKFTKEELEEMITGGVSNE